MKGVILTQAGQTKDEFLASIETGSSPWYLGHLVIQAFKSLLMDDEIVYTEFREREMQDGGPYIQTSYLLTSMKLIYIEITPDALSLEIAPPDVKKINITYYNVDNSARLTSVKSLNIVFGQAINEKYELTLVCPEQDSNNLRDRRIISALSFANAASQYINHH